MSKRKALTLDERVRVIELSKVKSARKIADDFGVGKTQIQNILKRKAEVIEDFENNVYGERKRARRTTGNEDINDLVLQWFKDATTRKLPISGPILSARALKFAEELGNDTFKASTGWLASFLSRNNIVLGTMSGEHGDVNNNLVSDWISKVPTLCAGYDPSNIFNMDETGLFFRDTTRKSYHFKGTELTGGKRSKERLTVSLCASMTGEKLQPLVIGKSAKPRCFSKINPENLPVMYRHNKKAWMTSDIMTQWLTKVNRQMKRQGRKILLFLDNAPSHPHVTFENIKLVFLPPNTTSLSQPMDQGIIQALKLKYRKRQLQYVLSQMEKCETSGTEMLKTISILDAIYWINSSWKEVEASTIQKCFVKCGFKLDSDVPNDDSDYDYDEDNIPLSVLKMSKELFGVDFKDLVDLDNSAPICDLENSGINWDHSASTILNDLKNCSDDIACDDDDDDDCDDANCETDDCINSSQAYEMIEKLKGYALRNGQENILESIMDLQELFVSSRCEIFTKQTKISDFFGK